jgi:hypothetical protein
MAQLKEYLFASKLKYQDCRPNCTVYSIHLPLLIAKLIASIQGGQMKSGQILSRNNSKTGFEYPLQISYTGYLVHWLRPVTAQWLQVSDLCQRLHAQRLKEGAP